MSTIRIGFIPLTDAAVLIAAAELGYAEREGISIQLEREASWATMRDKLAFGIIDAAHLLAPLGVAMSLGLGQGPAVRLVTPIGLHLNGNAITFSTRLWDELDIPDDAEPAKVAEALARTVKRRKQTGAEQLTLATVFPYSTHTFLLRRLLELGGISLESDVRLTVVPPPYTANALQIGAIDGFCVGSPWNSVAVAAGTGRIAAFGSELIPDAPDKVLAWPKGRLDEVTAGRLVRAVTRAGDWCASPSNHAELSALLAEPRHLGVDPALISSTLCGRVPVRVGGPVRADGAFIRFGGQAHRPSLERARWVFEEMVAAGLVEDSPANAQQAAAVFRSDLFDEAFAGEGGKKA